MKPKSIFGPLLAILTVMAVPFSGMSQSSTTPNNYVLPSPQAMTFMKYGEYPVSHSTGVPDISIPLYTVDLGDFSFPISATFHASGRMAALNYSPLGLNWNLAAHGMISREIRGTSDESVLYVREHVEKTADFYEPATPMTYTTKRESYEKMLSLAGEYPSGPDWDGQYDLYTLSMPGMSAKFIIRNVGEEVVFLSHVPYKVVRTSTDLFTLTDERGVEYVFGSGTIPGYSGTYGAIEDFIGGEGASSWLIQRITTPNERQIRFKYSTVTTGPSGPMSGNISYNDRLTVGDNVPYRDNYPIVPPSTTVPTATSGMHESEFVMAYLTRIESDVCAINFTYTSGNLFLTEMQVNDVSGDAFRTVSFLQGTWFTNSNPLNLPNNNAKTVDAITYKDRNGVEQERYTFSYYTSSDDYDNSWHAYGKGKDIWGYANSNRNATLIPGAQIERLYEGPYNVGSTISRQTDLAQKRMGMIKEIHYPTGGYSEFVYEENKYNDLGSAKSGPGLRIKQIISDDGTGNKTTKEYRYGAGENGMGLLMWKPSIRDFETIQFITHAYELIVLDQETGYIDEAYRYRWRVYTSDPSPQLAAAYRLPIYYDQVAEYTYATSAGISQSNGKTVYKYSQPICKYPNKVLSDDGTGSTYYFQGFTFQESSVPKLLNRTDYRRDGATTFTPILEKRYDYDDFNVMEIPQMWVYRFNRVVDRNSGSSGLNDDELFFATYFYSPSGTWNVLSVLEHKIHSAASKLVSETTIAYESGSVAYETVTNYRYDSPYHLFPTATEVSNSDGTKTVTRMVYPQDYTNTAGFIGDMKSRHLVGVPIENVTTKEAGGVRSVVSGSITTYKAGGKGHVDQVLELETALPVPSTSFRFSNRPAANELPHVAGMAGYSPDVAYKPQLAYSSYDGKGNPLAVTETGGLSTGYLWSYNGRYPVARADNAVQSDIAYTGFESDSKGNWSYAGTALRDWTAPTGKYAYNLGGGNLQKAGLSTSTKYLLTYWANSATATGISGGTATVMRTKGGWTQYRRVISGVGTITLSGSTKVDDVRLHPLEAQMETYTYDQLVGMTSRTDASGNVQYYGYDEFGRLQLVRDLEGNVIESYCYNYRGDAVSCGGAVYFSAVKSGSFTKDDCSTGEQGGTVTYTVPAGAYVSMVSQADADQRAQNDVNTNGQQYANQTGSCQPGPVSVTIHRTMGWNGSLGRITFNSAGNLPIQIFPSNIQPTETIQIPSGQYTSIVFDITESNASVYHAFLSIVTASGNACAELGFHSGYSNYTVTLSNVTISNTDAPSIWVAEYCH